jgi:hypothetical protein
MISAGGYILRVGGERVQTLLDHAAPGTAVGEPVAQFALSRRAPLLVLCSFARNAITHIADGRKGVASGTRLVRLNLDNLEELAAPIMFDTLVAALPARMRSSVARRLQSGGPLSSKGLDVVVEALAVLAPDISGRLVRFRAGRYAALAGLSQRARASLAEQKESVGLAMKISGLDTRPLLDWQPPEDGSPPSFLDGLGAARVREDAMIVHDLGTLPGFEAIKDYPFAAKRFAQGDTRLTIMLANKLPLEEQFGTDLIYFNETFQSFVMVQYKAMEREAGNKAIFRLPNAQLDEEISRMDATSAALAAFADDSGRDGYRLNTDPFILKLCARHIFNPDDAGLFPGMYLPLGYWRRLVEDPATLGPRSGRQVTFDNVGRKLGESDFVALVAGGWIGTHSAQSAELSALIRVIIESGKAVVLAVRSGGTAPSWRL